MHSCRTSSLTSLAKLAIKAIIYLSAFASTVAQGQDDHGYRVEANAGVVSYWSPWAVRWHEVSDPIVLPESTLLQVSPGSQATVYLPKSIKGKRSIVISRPMIIRLRKGILRKVRIEREYLDKLPDSIQAEEQTPLPPLLSEMSEAWDKLMAMVGQLSQGQNSAYQLEMMSKQQDVQLRGEELGLKLLAPSSDTPVEIDPQTGHVSIKWTKARDYKDSYEVYMGKQGDKALVRIGSTHGNNFSLPIVRPGHYQVRVEAEAIDASTPNHSFQAIKPSTDYMVDAKTIEVLSPPHLFKSYAKDTQIISFAWEPQEHASYYEIELEFAGKVRRFPSKTRSMRLRLKAGQYRWQVVALDQDKQIIAKSLRNEIGIYQSSNDLEQVLRSSLDAKVSGSIFFQSGSKN